MTQPRQDVEARRGQLIERRLMAEALRIVRSRLLARPAQAE
jgi:hypothetical protein